MSAIAGLIPKIEGFQPIPNAVMIPFMETQSAALAFGFGLNYEYGKRTIRSMSNDKFNSLTSEQIAEISAQHSTVLLNRFIQAVPQVMPAQTKIFEQYVAIEKLKVVQNVELAKWVLANAPSILLDGDPTKRIIDPLPSNVTSRVDDGIKITTTYTDGRVEVTYHPKARTVNLTENLGITATTAPPPPPTVVGLDKKVVAFYENNVKVLTASIFERKKSIQGVHVSLERLRTGSAGHKLKAKELIEHTNILLKLQKEIEQQRRFLANVKRGQPPY